MDDDPRRTAAMSKDFQRVRGEQTKAHKTYIKKANIGLLSGLSGPKKKARQWQEQTRKSRCIYKFDAAGFQLKPKTAECEEQNRMKRRWTLPDKCHDVSDDDVGRPTTTAVL